MKSEALRPEIKFKKVGVLMGGDSAERDVSLAGGEAIADGLLEAGYNVVKIDVDSHVDIALRKTQIDAAFIALHGIGGEDGTIQGLLEMMRIPYTGSSVLASALAMDKAITRNILSLAGLTVAPGAVIEPDEPLVLPSKLTPAVVVKPVAEGSSVGVSIVKNEAAFKDAALAARGNANKVLVEQFIPGIEVNTALLNGQVLGAVEIEPHREFYDYFAKYDQGGSTHHIPPRLPAHIIDKVNEQGALAYRALGCSGAARIDFIVPPNADPVVLELNTIPGMTTTSLLPEIAANAGISFTSLVTSILSSARLHCGFAPKNNFS